MADSTAATQATIVDVARQMHVDPELALAIAKNESGFNAQAVGDHGTSFGLYQLHSGGELESLKGSLSSQKKQAFDPATNARVALTEVARVAKAHPNWSPGQIAAAAQRPADPSGYASRVNAIYQDLTKSNHLANIDTYNHAVDTAASTAADASSVGNKVLLSGPADAIAGAVEDPFGVKTLLDKLTSTSFLTRLAFIGVGFVVLFIGVAKLTNVNPAAIATKASVAE